MGVGGGKRRRIRRVRVDMAMVMDMGVVGWDIGEGGIGHLGYFGGEWGKGR